MASYTISVNSRGWEGRMDEIVQRISRIDEILDNIAVEEVLPILAAHYDASGIRTRSGALKSAISKRGATGNRIEKSPGRLVVGVDYAQVPYARFVLEGRGPVHATRGKALHWIDPDTGKDVFAKSVGPAPAHDVYYLTPAELAEVEAALTRHLMRDKR